VGRDGGDATADGSRKDADEDGVLSVGARARGATIERELRLAAAREPNDIAGAASGRRGSVGSGGAVGGEEAVAPVTHEEQEGRNLWHRWQAAQ
jgi:hypothetical protein